MVSRLAEAIGSMLLADARPPQQSPLTINSSAVPKVASDSIAPACHPGVLRGFPLGSISAHSASVTSLAYRCPCR
jgi:hypothetical protein